MSKKFFKFTPTVKSSERKLPRPYFLSLHHQFRLDENLPALAPLDEQSRTLIRNAAGVLMPKYFSPSRHRLMADLARTFFPDLSARYCYRGKAQQIRLFEELGVPHPRTLVYTHPCEAVQAFRQNGAPWGYPCVLKGDSGGGGAKVFRLADEQDFRNRIGDLPADEPVLVQECIDHGGMDLRVVLMGRQVQSYFRVGQDGFYNNVSKGAGIHPDLFPERQHKGRTMALGLAREVGIDLAGFDILFPVQGDPLFLEINFLFGRKGLGGMQGYREMFRRAVEDWIQRVRSEC